MSAGETTAIHIGPETETGRGWSYRVTIDRLPEEPLPYEVSLSWSDHDLLSGGFHPPSKTVEAAITVAISRVELFARLPARFDVSTLRRMIPGFDGLVREKL